MNCCESHHYDRGKRRYFGRLGLFHGGQDEVLNALLEDGKEEHEIEVGIDDVDGAVDVGNVGGYFEHFEDGAQRGGLHSLASVELEIQK